jgi:hypothetical protein
MNDSERVRLLELIEQLEQQGEAIRDIAAAIQELVPTEHELAGMVRELVAAFD